MKENYRIFTLQRVPETNLQTRKAKVILNDTTQIEMTNPINQPIREEIINNFRSGRCLSPYVYFFIGKNQFFVNLGLLSPEGSPILTYCLDCLGSVMRFVNTVQQMTALKSHFYLGSATQTSQFRLSWSKRYYASYIHYLVFCN